MLLGEPHTPTDDFADVRRYELVAVAPLLVLSLVIGVLPRWLLDVIEPASAAVVRMLGGGVG